MKIKLSHLIVLLTGVVITISLSFLPKYVVNDKEKKLRDEETKVRQQVTEESAQHASSGIDANKTQILKTKLESSKNPLEQIVLVDSLTKMYRDAFLLDSSMITYIEYGNLTSTYYVQAIKDGLTGIRMNASNSTKSAYYEDLCNDALKKGLSAQPDNKELLVQQLRLGVYGKKAKTQGPMQSILAIKKLVEDEPNLVSARMTYAEFLTMRAQINPEFLEKAIEQYTKVSEIDVDNLESRLELVTLHLNSGNKSKAKEFLLQLQQINKVDKDPFIKDFVNKSLNNL